ncbi:MAG: hypothetical protein AB8B88_08675 [Devosiaceae bacterium]
MRTLLLALSTAVLLTSPAMAQLVTEPRDADRYHLVEIEDGVMRIDRQTGEITQCRNGANGWICRLAADDRLAYEAEINRLDSEVDRLTEELALTRQAAEDAGADISLLPEDQLNENSDAVRERLGLPDAEELDAVMDTAEEAMRRFMGMVQNLRDDIEAE